MKQHHAYTIICVAALATLFAAIVYTSGWLLVVIATLGILRASGILWMPGGSLGRWRQRLKNYWHAQNAAVDAPSDVRKSPMTTFPPDLDRVIIVFRGLLIAEICLVVLTVPLGLLAGVMSEASMQEIAPSDDMTVAQTVVAGFSCLFFAVFLPAIIAAWVGLFQFQNWARWLYLGTNAFGYVGVVPLSLFDFSFQWGFVDAMTSIAAMLTGCNLSLLFFSELASLFDESRQVLDAEAITSPSVP